MKGETFLCSVTIVDHMSLLILQVIMTRHLAFEQVHLNIREFEHLYSFSFFPSIKRSNLYKTT